MTRRNWLTLTMVGVVATVAQLAQAMGSRPSGFGVVVNTSMIHGTQIKHGVEVTSDTGRHLAGFASLATRIGPGGGQTSGYGGMGLPQWVDVRWRTGDFIQRFDPKTNSVWTGGTVIATHRVEVASRIPEDVLRHASAERGRAIKLMFRILDDDVVLGWCVQGTSEHRGWIYSNFGGDFQPAEWVQGVVTAKGWYIDKKTGQKIETTTGH